MQLKIPEFINAALIAISASVKTVLWPVFAIAVVFYLIVSFVLLYHWRRYSLHNKRIALAEITYFVVSIGVIGIAALSLILA